MKIPLNAILMAIFLRFFVLKIVASFPAQEPFTLTEAQDGQQRLEETGYNPYRGRKVLDSKGRCVLEWEVDHKTKFITFNITCSTTGWVGLGFSKDGQMKKADLVIGGVGSNGPYIVDMYADYSRKLNTDVKQNWTLISATENHGVTFLQVTRPFDTCDPFDYPITMDLLWVIWAFGETDDSLEYHFDKRGRFRIYLLDPIIQTQEKPLDIWKLRNTVTLSGKRTTYVCTIHKSPLLTKKQSIVEIHAYLENEISVQHTHHIVLYRCVTPPSFIDVIFFPWTLFPGEECYFVGFPLGEIPLVNEYYMMEIHYNNPLGYSGVTLTSGLDIHYTDKLRPNNAGGLLIFYDPLGLFIVPPISTNFEVYGYCTPNCTNAMIPKSGVDIVGVLLHGHISTTKVRLYHSRNGTKPEIILKDDNYDSTFQHTRILHEPRRLMPNEQLVISCEHDNTWTNNTTLSGFATFEEMCMVGLILSKRIPYFLCNSQIPQEKLLPLIGVKQVKWNMNTQERNVTSPASLAGKSLQSVADVLTNWDKSLRHRIKEVTLKEKQIGVCPQVLAPGSFKSFEDMLGIIIASDVKPEDFLTMASGYGKETLLGSIQLPTRTPGPISDPIQEGVEYTIPRRNCPRILSPFIAAMPVGNSFDGRAVGKTAPAIPVYLAYRKRFM